MYCLVSVRRAYVDNNIILHVQEVLATNSHAFINSKLYLDGQLLVGLVPTVAEEDLAKGTAADGLQDLKVVDAGRKAELLLVRIHRVSTCTDFFFLTSVGRRTR